MVSKKIEHPLRTIELAYDERKPFQPFEEEMLVRYTRLHNFVKELYEEYTDVQNRYEVHDRNIRSVIGRYKAIRARMGHMMKNTASAIDVMFPDRKEAEKTLQEAAEFKKLLESFHNDIEQLAGESNSLYQVFIPLDSKDEQLVEIFTEYKDFREELYNNYSNYSLNLEQYDADEQGFFDSFTNMADKQDEFIRVCNMVIDRYNLLIEEVEKTYKEWEQYSSKLETMQTMLNTPFDISLVCLN